MHWFSRNEIGHCWRGRTSIDMEGLLRRICQTYLSFWNQHLRRCPKVALGGGKIGYVEVTNAGGSSHWSSRLSRTPVSHVIVRVIASSANPTSLLLRRNQPVFVGAGSSVGVCGEFIRSGRCGQPNVSPGEQRDDKSSRRQPAVAVLHAGNREKGILIEPFLQKTFSE